MNKARAFFVPAGILCLALLLPRSAAATWPTSPTVNVPLCTAAGQQAYPAIVSDGAGGAIITWYVENGAEQKVYAQRISYDGTVQWTVGGVPLCTATGPQWRPAIASDGKGGAIVAWLDNRRGNTSDYGDIYAQRISFDGAVQWPATGVVLCTGTGVSSFPAIVSDRVGGAIVTWGDNRNNDDPDIYAQRISFNGTPQWQPNGVALCTASHSQYNPVIASDGAGGAIVTWNDDRHDVAPNYNPDIYAQWISFDGKHKWQANGVAVCTAAGNQGDPAIVSDGMGGAIVTWWDQRTSGWPQCDIYAQRLSFKGAPQWQANGVALCTAAGERYEPILTSDGAGGAIVAWRDMRDGNWDIYARRISSGGTPRWQPDGVTDGVAICTATGSQGAPAAITSTRDHGAIVTWPDSRSGTSDIYAQKISRLGVVRWTLDGVAVCTAAGGQGAPAITSACSDGVIVAWADARSDDGDIYAQRVDTLGVLGGNCSYPVAVSLVQKTDYITGNQPRCVVIGDWGFIPRDSSDKRSALVIANQGSNAVSVLFGDSTGSFGAKTDYGTGSAPYSVAIGDLNGDWRPDLAVANYASNTVSVLLGDSTGSFGPKTDYGTGSYPFSVAIGDLNGDWIPDLAVANWSTSNTVSVLLGNGDGTFGPKTDFATGIKPISVAIGDLNGDWIPDLAVANQGYNTLSVLLGNGDGTFGPKTDFATGSYPFFVAIGDLNGDFIPDLAVANRSSSTVSVLLGDGDGTFGAKTDFATGVFPLSVAIGDLDADGIPDLATANHGDPATPGNTVSVLLGNGDGTFGAKQDFEAGTRPISVAIGDLNDDGLPDLAVANYSSNTVSVLLNTSTSTVGVGPEPTDVPRSFQLLASRPNPSREASEIRFQVPSACAVDVTLFDLAGRKVRSLAAGERLTPGEHSIRWDGRDGSGAPVSNGVYLVQVRAGGDVGVRKLVVLH